MKRESSGTSSRKRVQMPHLVLTWALLAASTFALAEKDPAVRALRVAFLGLFQRRMKEILGLLGIPVPERM